MSELEPRIAKLEDTVSQQTRNVDKLVFMMEASREERKSDLETIKEAIHEIHSLNTQVTKMMNYTEDLNQCKQDVRVAAHDAKTALNTLQAIPTLLERIKGCEGKIELIETLRDKLEGGGIVIKNLIIAAWVVGGTGFVGLVLWLVKTYLLQGDQISGY